MKVDFQKGLQEFRISQPTRCSTETESLEKIVKISVSLLSEEELREKFESLPKKGEWDKECDKCKYPEFLHKTYCQRTAKVGEAEFVELWKEWSKFKEKMVKISVGLWSEEDLRQKFETLPKKGEWDKECEKCKYSVFVHKKILLGQQK